MTLESKIIELFIESQTKTNNDCKVISYGVSSYGYYVRSASVIFIIGIGGATLVIGAIKFTIATLATLAGLILSIFFHVLKKLDLNT